MNLGDEIEQQIRFHLSQIPEVQQAYLTGAPVGTDLEGALRGLSMQIDAIRQIAIPRLATEIDALKGIEGDTEPEED